MGAGRHEHHLNESDVQLSTLCVQLKLTSADGKTYKTDCVNTENAFRIIQSVPSPKAEPFKRWLAKVGRERIDEIENPELSMERMKELYEKKGYPKEWIDKRMRGIAVRQDLTDEWQNRGARTSLEYAILTNSVGIDLGLPFRNAGELRIGPQYTWQRKTLFETRNFNRPGCSATKTTVSVATGGIPGSRTRNCSRPGPCGLTFTSMSNSWR